MNTGTSMSATASETMNEFVMVCSDFVETTATPTSRLPKRVSSEMNERLIDMRRLVNIDGESTNGCSASVEFCISHWELFKVVVKIDE